MKSNVHLFLMFCLGCCILSLVYIFAWISVFAFDLWRNRKFRVSSKLKSYIPFTAGRLSYPDGKPRADAFGIKIPFADRTPQPGTKIQVSLGKFGFRTFTVMMCETLTRLGTNSPGEGRDFERSPEVYVLVQERLSDSEIEEVKKVYGPTLGFDPRREPINATPTVNVKNLTEAHRRSPKKR